MCKGIVKKVEFVHFYIILQSKLQIEYLIVPRRFEQVIF